MFPIGLGLTIFGYALFYTGACNLLTGNQGPSVMQSLRIPGAKKNDTQTPTIGFDTAANGSGNMTGQPATTAPPPVSGVFPA